MLGDVNAVRGFTSFVNPSPKPVTVRLTSAVPTPRLHSDEELDLVLKGRGVESGLRCLTHGAPRKSSLLPSPARAGLCWKKSVLHLLMLQMGQPTSKKKRKTLRESK